MNPLDYGIWAEMKKFLMFDLGVRTEQEVVDGLTMFFDTHQELIRDAILGSVKGLVLTISFNRVN